MKLKNFGHVLGYAALTVVLTAGAAQSLSGSNTVTGDDIVDGTIKTADLGAGVITGSRLMDGTITGVDVATNTLSGADINERSLADTAFRKELPVNCSASSGIHWECTVGTFTTTQPAMVLTFSSCSGASNLDLCTTMVDGKGLSSGGRYIGTGTHTVKVAGDDHSDSPDGGTLTGTARVAVFQLPAQ